MRRGQTGQGARRGQPRATAAAGLASVSHSKRCLDNLPVRNRGPVSKDADKHLLDPPRSM